MASLSRTPSNIDSTDCAELDLACLIVLSEFPLFCVVIKETEMTNEEFWVFSESLLAEDGSTKCPVMVSIQKSSKQRKKTVREDRNWLHLIFHSSKGFSVVFNWRKDM